jgi:pseudaminic acid synthase
MIIDGREIGPNHPPYIVAEVSCNHAGSFDRAMRMIEAAKGAGADAVKFQAYEAGTITLDSDNEDFIIKGGPWAGQRLYDLYSRTQTPFDWFPAIASHAREIGITWFASVFDKSSVDMLDRLGCPAYKIASMEIVDTELIRYAANKRKPIILSTGMASYGEIAAAMSVVPEPFNTALLHCISAYPTPFAEANLPRIELFNRWWDGKPVGISDHSTGTAVAVAAVALGACIVEKHFSISRHSFTADSLFSLDILEFKELCKEVRRAWAAMRVVNDSDYSAQNTSRQLRRSLYVVEDVKAGERFTRENVRSIRPAHGLPPGMINNVIGKKATCDIKRGTALHRQMVALD